MLPLSIFLFFATAAPPQQAAMPQLHVDRGMLVLQARPVDRLILESPLAAQDNTCLMIRTYHFHRQDGQAPVLTGMTTCTPASKLRQRQVSPGRVKFVPLALDSGEQENGRQ
ncbi:MAG: hypothetical protein WA738_09965 [Candidatus Angelobacter sp.]